jgi:hypothetical protein
MGAAMQQLANNVQPAQLEQQAKWACEVARVRYCGVQKMYGTREDVFLFQQFDGATTLALPLSKATPVCISYKILEAQKAA